MFKKSVLLIATSSLVLGGCTTTLTSHRAKTDLQKIPKGIEYRLPETRIDVEAHWILDDCKTIRFERDAKNGNVLTKVEILSLRGDPKLYIRKQKPEKHKTGMQETGKLEAVPLASLGESWPSRQELEQFPIELGIKPSASFEAKTIEGEKLLIDYEELTANFKTGSLQVEYHPNTMIMKSINAEVQGQEAEAIKSAIGFAGSVARIAFGLPGATVAPSGGASNETNNTIEQCTDATKELVTKRHEILKAIKVTEGQLTDIKAKIGAINLKLATEDLDEKKVEELKAKLKKQKKNLETADGAVKAQKAALAYVNNKLSVSKKGAFPGKDGKIAGSLEPGVDALKRAFKGAFRRIDDRDWNAFNTSAKLAVSVSKVRDADLTCDADSEAVGCSVSKSNSFDGVLYRSPVPAKLEVKTAKNKTVLNKPVKVIQLGRLQLLPLKNDFAESNSLEVTFDQSGVPTKVAYAKTKSGGKQAIDAFGAAASEALKVQQEVAAFEKAKKDAIKAAADDELTELQRKRDLLKTQDEIDDLTTPTPSEVAVLKAEVDTLTLKAQIAELEKRIRDAENDEAAVVEE